MVKQIDENISREILDHIGWRLWRLGRAWKARFGQEMVALGHAWFDEARSGVLVHLGPSGIAQADLPARMGLTKQAVQQMVDDLVRDGIVEQRPVPGDGRRKRIVLTKAGLAVMADTNEAKRRIEAEYRAILGDTRFDAFSDALGALLAADTPTVSHRET